MKQELQQLLHTTLAGLATELGIQVPDDDDYETIGGFLSDVLDRLPERGDEIEVGDWTMRVVRMDGLRVDRVRVAPIRRDGSEHAGAAVVDDDGADR